MKPCIFTGRLIRAYLEVALASGRGSDKVRIQEVAHELMKLEKTKSPRNPRELQDALVTLRKNVGLSTLGGIRRAVAANGKV
jgi:hypothetical protein